MRALRLLKTTVAIAGFAFGTAQAKESIFVNYGVLDHLPPAVAGAVAPQLTPPGMIKHHAVPASIPVVSNSPIGVGPSVPPIFDRTDTLYNRVVITGDEAAGPVFGNPSRLAAVGPRPDGISGATRSRSPNQQTAMLGGQSYNPAALPSDNAAEPRMSWDEAKPIGEVLFRNDGVEVLDIDRHALVELDQLARQLCTAQQRILLRAFGGMAGDDSHEAHRTALRRGLAIRRYLIARGVSSNLIDVTAVGGATDGGPLNRVDLVLSSG